MSKIISAQVMVSGRVQGVSFRAWTKRRAKELGLVGWVKNLPDGTVQALFEGEEAVVEEMLKLIEKGPALSKVSGKEVSYNETVEGFKDFVVTY